jgi:hypothetical protein
VDDLAERTVCAFRGSKGEEMMVWVVGAKRVAGGGTVEGARGGGDGGDGEGEARGVVVDEGVGGRDSPVNRSLHFLITFLRLPVLSFPSERMVAGIVKTSTIVVGAQKRPECSLLHPTRDSGKFGGRERGAHGKPTLHYRVCPGPRPIVRASPRRQHPMS